MLESTGKFAVLIIWSKGPTMKSCIVPFFCLYTKTATSPSFTRKEEPQRIAFSRLLSPSCTPDGCHFQIRYDCSSQYISSIEPPLRLILSNKLMYIPPLNFNMCDKLLLFRHLTYNKYHA